MNKFTKEMVDEYANKLLIGLTAEENQMVLDEFSVIDESIKDIDKVEPMTHCLDDFTYELREDEVIESVDIDDLLSNCDVHTDREVEIPKVVGE